MLYRLLQLRTISVSAVFVIVIARRKEKEEHSTFVFFAFIEYRLPRFGRKYYALLFDFFSRLCLRTESRFPLIFFWLCSAARPTEPSFDSRFSVIEQISTSPSLLTPRFCQEQKSDSLIFVFAQQLDWLSRELNWTLFPYFVSAQRQDRLSWGIILIPAILPRAEKHFPI